MSFTIKHGLFKANITDYHAILGVSLNADVKKIRLKYLRIAQKLHPDTCKADAEGKKLASQLLSKLVNPAYEQLSNKNLFAEHQLILTQIGKRYAEKSDRMTVASEPAKKLLQADRDLDKVYHQLLKELTTDQYQQIDCVLKRTAIISELNLIYLMLSHKQGITREERVIRKKPLKTKSTSSKAATQSNLQPTQARTQPEEQTPESRVTSYIRRAKEYMAKENYNDAITELKDAIRINPNSSTGHALMGKAYLKQNQLTMAKVHINKAYKANPKDPIVIENKELLEKLVKQQKRKSAKTSNNSGKKKSSDSGFLSGFFSKKK